MSGLYIGIDPGENGAIVASNERGPVEWLVARGGYHVPKLGPDLAYIRRWLVGIHNHEAIAAVAIEEQAAFVGKGKGKKGSDDEPRMGASSALTTGKGWGGLRGLVVGLGLRLVDVRPRDWQSILKGAQGTGKGRAIAAAGARWPDFDLRRTPRCATPCDGLADAAWIAEWLRVQP